jgi:predicted CopG family antitoxin
VQGGFVPRIRARRKEKKTFSLSRDAVTYLQTLRKAKHGKSISSILEELIRQQREIKEMERASASVSAYYDSLNDEQIAEDRAWGQFAEGQFPTEE